MVLEKPAGLSVHNDPGKDLIEVVRRIENNPTLSVHPVHRLDRETSGLVLMATRPEVHRTLATQFENRSVTKRYLALVHGHPKEEAGHWKDLLTNRAEGRKHPAGSGKRVPCDTEWKILETSVHYALLTLTLHTGRKHQIRRHAALNRTPLVGDTRYGTRRALKFLEERHADLRLGLHAHELTFRPPETGAPVTVTSSGLPEFLSRLLATDTLGSTE